MTGSLMSIPNYCYPPLPMVITRHPVVRNADGNCLIICDSTSRSCDRTNPRPDIRCQEARRDSGDCLCSHSDDNHLDTVTLIELERLKLTPESMKNVLEPEVGSCRELTRSINAKRLRRLDLTVKVEQPWNNR